MHNREMPLLPDRLEGSHGRVQHEKTVKIDDGTAWNIYRRPHGVISLLAVGHDNVQAVSGPALKDDNQAFWSRVLLGTESGTLQECRQCRSADQRQRAIA